MALPLADKIKPKNNGSFALVDAVDIEHNGVRLSEIWPVYLTQEEYDALVAAGKMNPNTYYVILPEG